MPLTIARLRQGIVILAGLLVAVLIGFLIYAHYRIRRFERDLPARLGANVQQTANGYTYSQSSNGHTLFTIHASRLIQYKRGGNATLHDVAITLYGPPGSKRVDKIQGASFSYDAKNQIVTAQGIVSIDLQGFGNGGKAASPQNAIHVRTSGLVFNQKTGEADTAQHTEFSFPKASGSSTGAHYNSKTGVLVLDSNVAMTAAARNRLAVLHASHARIERESNEAFLLNPSTQYGSEKGSSDAAVVTFRDDGSAQSIHAQGHVHVVTADGAALNTPDSLMELNDKSQLTRADLTGGLKFVSSRPDEQMRGSARTGTLIFGGNSALRQARFRGGVNFADTVARIANDPKGSASRNIAAASLDVDFVRDPHGKKTIARQALAIGNASVRLVATFSKGAPQSTTINGDKLLALLSPDGKSIRQLNGTGNTRFVDVAKDGSTNTSAGNTLGITFSAQPGAKRAPHAAPPLQIDTAVQDGNVVLTQTPAQKPGAPAPASLTAWAQHSEYHAADQRLSLTGNPRLQQDSELQLTAAQIDYHRDSGDATASGGVKATYGSGAKARLSINGNGPIHVTADHAVLRHSTGVSTFYGAASTDARMWQGADSILAPVIELTREPQTLKAHGSAGSSGAVVVASLTSAAGPDHRPSPIRIQSRTLVYVDAQHRADFSGQVTATGAEGVVHANNAQAYFTTAPPSAQHAAGGQSRLDHIIATGQVVLTGKGRTGTGERLVYTASDGKYVLSGSPGNPPRMEEAGKGVTTGAKLIFDTQNGSVMVSGGRSSAVTVTRAPK